MSQFGLTPFFPRWFDDMDRSHSLFDQFFGQPLVDEDLLPPTSLMPYYFGHPAVAAQQHRRAGRHHHPHGQAGPLRPSFDRHRSGMSLVSNDKGQFTVNLDVHQFKPEELTVKTVDKYVIIEGKHEEKEDEHGYIQRHFVRKYLLPEGTKPESVTSTLSSDGVLLITAPKQPAVEAGGERVVPISASPYPAIAPAKVAVASNGVAAPAQQGKPGEKMES